MDDLAEFGHTVGGNSSLPLLILHLFNLTRSPDKTDSSLGLVEKNGGIEDIELHIKKMYLLEKEKDVMKKNDMLHDSLLHLQTLLSNTLQMYSEIVERNEKLEGKLVKLSDENLGLQKELTDLTNKYHSVAEQVGLINIHNENWTLSVRNLKDDITKNIQVELAQQDSEKKKLSRQLKLCKSLQDELKEENFNEIKKLMDMSTSEREKKLIYASEKDLDTVRQLLLLKTNVHYRDHFNDTALSEAAYKKNEEIAILLVDAGSDVENVNRVKNTPLIYSSNHNLLNLTEHLLDNGAKVNRRGERGRTALQWAAATDFLEIVQLLIDHGADRNIKDDDGRTAFEVAKYYNKTKVEKWLSIIESH